MEIDNEEKLLIKDTLIQKFSHLKGQLKEKSINLDNVINSELDEFIYSLAYLETLDQKFITSTKQYARAIKSSILKDLITSTTQLQKEKFTTKSANKIYNIYKSEEININDIRVTEKAPLSLQSNYAIHLQLLNNNEKAYKTYFKSINSDNFLELIKANIDETYAWCIDNNLSILSYKYIFDYSYNKLLSWLKIDLKIAIFNIMTNKQITFTPLVVDNLYMRTINITPLDFNLIFPIDITNRKTTTICEDNSFKYVHEINSEMRLITIIDVPDFNKEGQTKQQGLFNLIDAKVIQEIIKLSDKDFFATKNVICSLVDLVKGVYKTSKPNSDMYARVKNSLTKISTLESRYENDITNEVRHYGIFKADTYNVKKNSDNVILGNDGYANLYVKTVFADSYMDLLLSNTIFTKDEDTACLKSNMAQALIIPLQGERYKHFSKEHSSESALTITLGYSSFFNRVLVLGKSNKSRNIQLICAALDEIVNSNTIIESYERRKDFFIIKLKPIRKNEKEGLLKCINYYSDSSIELPLARKIANIY